MYICFILSLPPFPMALLSLRTAFFYKCFSHIQAFSFCLGHRTLSAATALELFTAAWWVRRHTTEGNHFPLTRSLSVASSSAGSGWGLISPSQIHDWLLVGTFLCKTSAGNYSSSEGVFAMGTSCSGDSISHPDILAPEVLSTPSSSIFPEPETGWNKCTQPSFTLATLIITPTEARCNEPSSILIWRCYVDLSYHLLPLVVLFDVKTLGIFLLSLSCLLLPPSHISHGWWYSSRWAFEPALFGFYTLLISPLLWL